MLLLKPPVLVCSLYVCIYVVVKAPHCHMCFIAKVSSLANCILLSARVAAQLPPA